MRRILLVDDEPLILDVLSKLLRSDGYEATCESDGGKAQQLLRKEQFDLMVSDIRMTPVDGIQILRLAHSECPLMPVIMITAYASVATATEALKLGAFDYVQKPIRINEFLFTIRKALDCSNSLRINEYLRDRSAFPYRFGNFVAENHEMRHVCEHMLRLASTDNHVLICGETGVGKHRVARILHEHGCRSGNKFCVANCADIPAPLLDLTLFGTPEPASPLESRNGDALLTAANGGTLFLEDIDMMPPSIQAKLLTVLREKKMPGDENADNHVPVDVRIVAATHTNFEALMEEGMLLEDLFNCLTSRIHIKPLRERTEDILPLIAHILHQQYSNWDDLPILSPEVAATLVWYSWPGNVKELENVITQMTGGLKAAHITQDALPSRIVNAVRAAHGKTTPHFGRGEYWGKSLKAFLSNQLRKHPIKPIKSHPSHS
jgi:DNA-binding NtrC family response regulator